MQVGAQPEVRGVCDREIVEHREVAAGGLLRPLGGGRDSAIGAAGDVAVGHDSSVMSRYTAYNANQVITTTAMTSRISKKSTTPKSLSLPHHDVAVVSLMRP